MMRLAILASHEGTTMQSVIDACENNLLNAEVALVVSNNSTAGALRRAEQAQVPTKHISSKSHGDEAGGDAALLNALLEAKVDWVLLLGYMKKLGAKTLAHYSGKILNTHPALLPKFGGKGFFGRKVHEAVIAAGDRESGATIHIVDAEYDTGPVLSQIRLPVEPSDTAETLEDKVKAAEKRLLFNTLAELAGPQNAASA